MNGFSLRCPRFIFLGLILSSSAFLHASPPADSLHYCLPFEYEQWERKRPAGKRLVDLNTGESRTVRLFYFLPNDRPFRTDVVQRIKDEIRNIQVWFGEQIQAHGYGYKTFRFETDDQGEPLVHRVDGQHPDSHYLDNSWDLAPEVEQVFDLSKSIAVFVIDNSNNRINRTAAGQARSGLETERRPSGAGGIQLANPSPMNWHTASVWDTIFATTRSSSHTDWMNEGFCLHAPPGFWLFIPTSIPMSASSGQRRQPSNSFPNMGIRKVRRTSPFG